MNRQIAKIPSVNIRQDLAPGLFDAVALFGKKRRIRQIKFVDDPVSQAGRGQEGRFGFIGQRIEW